MIFASWYLLIDATHCIPLIYTPFGGLQSRGAGVARQMGVLSKNNRQIWTAMQFAIVNMLNKRWLDYI